MMVARDFPFKIVLGRVFLGRSIIKHHQSPQLTFPFGTSKLPEVLLYCIP
jgi:hypothetical protein